YTVNCGVECMAKKGEKYVCGVCGVEIVCVEGCCCTASKIICCGKKMSVKTAKKTATKSKAKKK
ncbi:MAG: hypothetical protein KKD39_03290, partial [Candidatus Altiarchaeota archaeon]|nr:hypothetical protein [Candidatus Altiarchaeota archaeon]